MALIRYAHHSHTLSLSTNQYRIFHLRCEWMNVWAVSLSKKRSSSALTQQGRRDQIYGK